MKFSEFNMEVNPNDENCYMVESSAGIKSNLSFNEAKVIMGKDPKATLYWMIPHGYVILTTTYTGILDIIEQKEEPVMVVKHNDTLEIYCRSSFDKTTVNNILACGISANTIAYSKAGRNVLLPFRNKKINTAPAYGSMDVVYGDRVRDIPRWMTPLRNANSPAAGGLDLPITDNSETTILSHLTNLKGFNKNEQIAVATVMSDYLCTVPLTKDEIKNIAAQLEENLLKQFFNKGAFLHYKLGDYIIDNCNVKRDETSKELYFYDSKKGIYVNDPAFLMGYITKLCPQLKQYQKDETVKYILNYLYEDSVAFNQSEYNVVFKNGILNVLNWTFEPMTPSHYESIQINIDYNPTAMSNIADEFFATATCGDKAIEQLLYEVIGYTMLKTNALAKSFILLGTGRNGKSTYLDVIKAILGRTNYTALSFKDLNNTFKPSSLINKLASCAGDISAQPIQESDMFKSITAYEDVQFEQKYKDSFTGKVFATMLYSCNKLPRTPDNSAGFYRRLVIVPFNANLAKVSTVDGIAFHDKLLSAESLEYIAIKALRAIYKVLMTTKEFTEPDAVTSTLNKYKIDNSTLLSWAFDKYKGDTEKLAQLTGARAYGNYATWCNESNRAKLSSTSFNEQMRLEFGIDYDTTK